MKYASNIKGQTWAERLIIDRLSKSVLSVLNNKITVRGFPLLELRWQILPLIYTCIL